MQGKLETVYPPAHTALLLIAATAVFIHFLPSLEEIDEVATIETFTTPVFSNGVFSSLETMGWTRIFFSFVIIATSIRFMIIGTQLTFHYLPGSKLTSYVLKIHGIRTQWWFTGWSWNMLGLYFFTSGLIPLLVSRGQEQLLTENPWILRTALLAFEIAAPNAFLVSTVVRYALWPLKLKQGGPECTATFKSFRGQMQHNANVAMVMFEVCLLGGTPVLLSHIAISPLFGVVYVLFVWAVSNHWCPETKRPTFPYFFLDLTLGLKATFMLVGLLATLISFYFLSSSVEKILEIIDGGPVTHVVCAVVLSSMALRFRD